MILARALRTAWWDVAGAVVACAAAFVLHVALVFWVFRDDPEDLGRYGLLESLALVVVAVGTLGLPSGLARLYPVRPEARADLLVSAWVGAGAACAVLVAALQFVPGAAAWMLGQAASEFVSPYMWIAPAFATVAVAAAALGATHNMRRRAAVQGTLGAATAVGGLLGAVIDGLPGLLWGSFAGALLVGAMLRPRARGGRPRAVVVAELHRIGRAQATASVLDAVVVLSVLQALTARDGDSGAFVAALGFVAPFIVLPELVARSLHPVPVGRTPDPGLERARSSVARGLAVAWMLALGVVTCGAAWLLLRAGHGLSAASPAPALALLPGVALHALVASSGRTVLVRRDRWRAAAASGAGLATAVCVGAVVLPVKSAADGAVVLATALTARSLALLALARQGSEARATTPASLDAVRAAADPDLFPRQVFAGNPKSVSFFSAAFHGRNDCIHLADAGITDALCVDLDDDKLAEMAAIYPPSWRFAAGDAYVVAESLRAVDAKFDLVVVDGWTGEAERMLTENFPLWCALSRRWTVLMVSRPWFAKQRVETTPAAVEEWARARHGIAITVDELHFRADWVGGVWWIVVRSA